jgi:antitoxin component HigA of HigAB toxin-antitoxin module
MKTRTIIRTIKGSQSREMVFAIHNEQEYELAVQRLEELVDKIGDDFGDPRYKLIETLSVLIDAYDRKHHRLPEASGVGRQQPRSR